jgi:Ser/Thr protein kinase RdoA (MazF antagonist)
MVGPSWVMRAYHEEHSLTDAFHFISGSQSLLEWLQGTAHTLSSVTNQGYPAPTIIPSLTGELVGTYQKWHMLMTTFVEGDARDTSAEKMAALGAAIGHLHALSLPEQPSTDSKFALSWWSSTRDCTA